MQPTPQQRNQMPHSQIRSQTSNMIPPGARIYDPNMPHQVSLHWVYNLTDN
jgi:hypothetical protein